MHRIIPEHSFPDRSEAADILLREEPEDEEEDEEEDDDGDDEDGDGDGDDGYSE
jgi:hypothetical protein